MNRCILSSNVTCIVTLQVFGVWHIVIVQYWLKNTTIRSKATTLNPNQPPLSLQFSIISITAPFWRPRTAQRWCCRWRRSWRLWKIRQEAATSQRWNTSTSISPSLWCCAHERGPSSVCCSCWAPCGWDTLCTSSSGGTYSNEPE